MRFLLIGLLLLRLVRPSMVRNTADSDYQQDSSYDGEEEDYPITEENESPEEELAASSDLPDFATRGGRLSVQEGSTITLPCQVNDLGKRQTMWTKRPGIKSAEDTLFIGAKEVASNARQSAIELPEAGGTILTITEVAPEDAGTYTCRIADTKMEKSLEFLLEVTQQPPQQPRHSQPQLSSAAASCHQTLLLSSWMIAAWSLLLPSVI